MNIIHVTYDASPYGIGTFLLNLLDFENKSYRNSTFSLAFHAEHKNLQKYKEIISPIYCLNEKTGKNIRIFFKFRLIFRNFDIINFHTFSPLAFMAAWALKKKVIYTFHGAFGFRRSMRDIPLRFFYQLVLNKLCKKVIFASETARLIYQEKTKCRLPAEKTAVFPYGLQIEKIKPKQTRQAAKSSLALKGNFIVGTAIRMDPVKRVELLINAFSGLSEREHAALCIVGGGDEAYQEYLFCLVKEHKIEDRVYFLGYREDVLDIVNTFDLFVLPSFHETFGMALLEAMALGIPSAVFKDGGGAVDILGDSGFVVESVEELRQVILGLNRNPSLRKAYSHKVKERARTFDIRYTAKNYQNIYRKLLEK